MPKALPQLRLRIVLDAPIHDVLFALQRGTAELVDQTRSSGEALHFELTVGYLIVDGVPDFRGPFVQGPRGGRFVYVCAGTSAGESQSCWTRRAKIQLSAITTEQIADCADNPDAVLSATIAGKGKDGGPPAATVPLLKGWAVAQSR